MKNDAQKDESTAGTDMTCQILLIKFLDVSAVLRACCASVHSFLVWLEGHVVWPVAFETGARSKPVLWFCRADPGSTHVELLCVCLAHKSSTLLKPPGVLASANTAPIFVTGGPKPPAVLAATWQMTRMLDLYFRTRPPLTMLSNSHNPFSLPGEAFEGLKAQASSCDPCLLYDDLRSRIRGFLPLDVSDAGPPLPAWEAPLPSSDTGASCAVPLCSPVCQSAVPSGDISAPAKIVIPPDAAGISDVPPPEQPSCSQPRPELPVSLVVAPCPALASLGPSMTPLGQATPVSMPPTSQELTPSATTAPIHAALCSEATLATTLAPNTPATPVNLAATPAADVSTLPPVGETSPSPAWDTAGQFSCRGRQPRSCFTRLRDLTSTCNWVAGASTTTLPQSQGADFSWMGRT
ncbi:hypothetical protein PAPYR_11603 [Paratrimastix pyriformis]|uniref:Uncharacterized protein n=1 Tax=Paratrimastix pyriformis TaxID=342808 RepID=A0ABQ8U8Z9_9EUKA|nr:hypothetical protein PAPYR_11603 [Paratrimastix pyriformis]